MICRNQHVWINRGKHTKRGRSHLLITSLYKLTPPPPPPPPSLSRTSHYHHTHPPLCVRPTAYRGPSPVIRSTSDLKLEQGSSATVVPDNRARTKMVFIQFHSVKASSSCSLRHIQIKLASSWAGGCVPGAYFNDRCVFLCTVAWESCTVSESQTGLGLTWELLNYTQLCNTHTFQSTLSHFYWMT